MIVAGPSPQLLAHVKANLPARYEAAKAALASCLSIDECKEWADKAAALASYGKQAKDEEFTKMAMRIRARAVRRMGEILQQIEPQQGGRPPQTRVPPDPSFSRTEVATRSGLSERQRKTSLRVANVPATDFVRQVETDNPVGVKALAEQGKKAAPRPVIDLKGRDPSDFNTALHYVAGWEQVARDLAALKHDSAVPILNDAERARLRKAITAVDAITDRIITRI